MSPTSGYKYLPAELAESLRHFGLSVRRPVQGLQQGLHRSPHFGASVEFAEYREYARGDPISLIDWSVYARSDRHMIRRYHEETNLRAYILLDTSASLGFQDEGTMTKLEYACYIAAGFMVVLAGQGDSVGLMLFDERLHETIEPVQTFEGLRPLLLRLETLAPRGRGDIEASIHDATAHLRNKSLVIVISDFLQETDRLNRGLRHLWHDGHNISAVHVLDPGERRLTFGGVASVRDMETGDRMTVEIDEIRASYHASVDRYLDELKAACTECMADYRLVDTRAPLDETLTRLFESKTFS